MITPGLAKALASWATAADGTVWTSRLQQLKAERDALVTGAVLSGGKASIFLNSSALNGKSFTAIADLSRPEKIVLLDQVIDLLSSTGDSVTFIDFSRAFQ